jgi:hypothetical protein
MNGQGKSRRMERLFLPIRERARPGFTTCVTAFFSVRTVYNVSCRRTGNILRDGYTASKTHGAGTPASDMDVTGNREQRQGLIKDLTHATDRGTIVALSKD